MCMQIEYEASTTIRTGFSSDSAQNLLKGKAASNKQTSLLDYICPHSGWTPLMAAVMHGHSAVAQQVYSLAVLSGHLHFRW